MELRKIKLAAGLFTLLFLTMTSVSKAAVPRPEKVVVCVLENHGYHSVIGSASAPYINHLSSIGANMVEYYALTHPSQPNYIMLYSGDNQGVTDDNFPVGTPWSTPNLGASLINAGFSFTGYSEDLPSVGSLVGASGSYGRKHSPWINWQGNGVNQIPSTCNLTMDHFPTDFSQLPDFSFVIPNMDNDMHNGTDPSRIVTGDNWVNSNLSAYVNWAMAHNSLLIVLFDEDDNASGNHIPCMFVGPMVQPGQYMTNGYHHYNMLRTFEEMYGLPYAGSSANSIPIEEIWMTNKVSEINSNEIKSLVFPNPVIDHAVISINLPETKSNSKLSLQIFDVIGNLQREETVSLMDLKSIPIRREDLVNGLYIYRLLQDKKVLSTGKFVVE